MTGPYVLEYRDGDGSFTFERVSATAFDSVLDDLAAGGIEVRYITGPGYDCRRCGAAGVAVQLPDRVCDRCRNERRAS